MNSLRQAGTIVLAFAALGAHAQVHRCGDSNVYTDKPCEDAEPVDLQSNTVPAVPKFTPPPPPQPAPARILPDMSRVVTSPPSAPSTIWQDKDNRDGAATSRTTGTR